MHSISEVMQQMVQEELSPPHLSPHRPRLQACLPTTQAPAISSQLPHPDLKDLPSNKMAPFSWHKLLTVPVPLSQLFRVCLPVALPAEARIGIQSTVLFIQNSRQMISSLAVLPLLLQHSELPGMTN